MKILQVNCVYNTGSTGKIVADLHTELQTKGYKSVVVYGRGAAVRESGVYRVGGELLGKLNHALSRLTGVLYGGCRLATHRLLRIIRREKPDVVHLHCINGFFVNIYRLLAWLGKHRIKTVLTLHAEFMYTGSCGYALDCEAWSRGGCQACPLWRSETHSLVGDRTRRAWWRMLSAFRHMQPEHVRIASVSPWLRARAERSVILGGFSHSVVFNGIDTDVFAPTAADRDTLYPHASGQQVIFHATAMFCGDESHIKGGYYLLQLAEQMKQLPVHFYVAGSYEEGLTVPDNVTLLGRVEDSRLLAAYYANADVTLLTSRRETFSMICAESLCCGTPVVGFLAGAPETIALPSYSRFVPFGDVSALQTAVTETLALPCDKAEVSRAAHAVYSKARMAEDYGALYHALTR